MANALGIDLGEVYRTVEAVKASRAARGANEAKATNSLATQQAAADYASGDQSALPRLISLNPGQAKTIIETFSALDENGRKKEREKVEKLGALAAGVLNAPDPAAAYQTLRSSLPPEAQKGLPETYDPNWVQVQVSRAVEVDKLYDAAEGRAKDARSHSNSLALQKDRQEFDMAKMGVQFQNKVAEIAAQGQKEIEVEAAKNGGAAGAQIEAKDTAPIYKQSVELLGGIFDENGNLRAMDPQTQAKAQAIAVLASKLWVSKQVPSHAEAVQQAARQLGVAGGGGNALTTPAAGAPAAPAANPNDPLGLLGN